MNLKGLTLLVFVLLLTTAIFLRNPNFFSFLSKSQLIDTAGVTEITISQIHLAKIKDIWVVASSDNFPADQNKIEELLTNLASLTTDNLVSTNPDNHDQYGVGENGVVLKIGEQTIIIGNSGLGFAASNYFRLADSDQVYLSDTSFEPTAKDSEWRDLALNFPTSINQITIQNNSGEFVFEQKDDSWILMQPQLEKVIETRVADLAHRLQFMRAEDATTSGELGIPAVTITVKGVEGEDALVIGQEEGNERLVKLNSSPYLYYLPPSEFGVFLDLDKEYFQAD
ncbi:hypothetical protein COW99_05250 [Candidatus Roizmanbacteria bacterium CG22_combo_CG10-13_8_21_14_all_38_20]|uniref:DUF4340 domain-containing protein n=1 Tax=Candidatus Roizmanbacteria bacterium CG22_combo_CG10-13_8_21_14_all_38_20 TaxID=1974862 RepID=A0A2H0BU67_9BACT|nr:DUF4340 domain-containing protein [Candidatus Microgenomates bacterium]PIP61171.1 MAG: hypothetical protein COW99_05250 [Candidatus Roizmanbacteria bacterium CG22_combo_CG10-13_8_21_14_all_38_20]PJC31161.1 MAG: hypothetical protein CO050_03915 [Candidatus Roizmanbacteria bacterium CG_4_9_14_0_2_um_filter_38_17]